LEQKRNLTGDLTAKNAKGAKKRGLTTKGTKFKSINIRTLRVLRAFVVNPSFRRLERLELEEGEPEERMTDGQHFKRHPD